MEARLKDQAHLGVLAAMALCSLSRRLRAQHRRLRARHRRLRAQSRRLSARPLVAEVHAGGVGEAEGQELVLPVHGALEAVHEDAQVLLLWQALHHLYHYVQVIGHDDVLEHTQLRETLGQLSYHGIHLPAQGVEDDVGILLPLPCQLSEEVRASGFGVCVPEPLRVLPAFRKGSGLGHGHHLMMLA